MKRVEKTAQFDKIFLQQHNKIHRIILRIVGNHQEAEDLTQETFVRLYNHFESIELERAHHWLHRVAVNFGLKAIRGRKRYQHWKQRAKEEHETLSYKENKDPLKAAMVRQVLSDLPERQSKLLLLHAAGWTYEELATEIQVKRTSISQLLARARRAFEKAYQQLEATEPMQKTTSS